VYEDYQESVYSSISKVPLSDNEVSASGIWVDEITKNNALNITIDTGSSNVKTINVAIRDASNLNSLPFFIFKKIDKFNKDGVRLIADNISYNVYFLNNEYIENIDTEYGNAYYHDVPLKAKDLILLDGKNIVMSMPQIGYDIKEEDVNFDLSLEENDTDFTSSLIPLRGDFSANNQKWDRCGVRASGKKTIKIYISEFYANASYRVIIKMPPAPDGYAEVADVLGQYSTGASEPDDFKSLAATALASDILSTLDMCATIPITVEAGDDYVKITFAYGFITYNCQPSNPSCEHYYDWRDAWKPYLDDYSTYVYGNILTTGYNPVYKSLKRGQYHPFGIVYNDGFGRYNIVVDSKNVYVPNAETEDYSKTTNAVITVNNLPPAWAKTYRIAYIPNNSYTYAMMVPVVEVILGNGIGGQANGIPPGKKFLKINQAILRILEDYPNSLIEAYSWINGDRLRQVGNTDSFEILREYTRTYTIEENTETETGYLLEADFDYITGTTDKIGLIEIYRPNLTPQDKIFYEIGEEYDIVDGYHLGLNQNQTASQPAISSLDFGDVYFRQRFSADVDIGYALVEDKSYSDYYISNGIDIGRGAVKIEMKQAVLNRTNKSENYIQNTELNRLNIFLAGGESYTVSEAYGDITRIIERGDTMKIIQSHKETSVYIGKNYAKDAKGGDIILATDKTFGSDSVYEAFLGSLYPRSVRLVDNNLYYFDSISADFVRSATNGSISLPKEFGMQSYFNNVTRRLKFYLGNKDVITSFEPYTNTVYLSFVMGSTIETIAFTEDAKSRGFIFFVEFSNGNVIPEDFASYGDDMYSFTGGKIWKHGFGSVNEFYGSDRKVSSLEFITNQYPEAQKSFETMSIDSDGEWSSEMNIDKDNNYLFGQKTKILEGMFKNREGSLVSSIPMNIMNRKGVEDIQLLYSGNKMLGHSMKVSISSVNFDKLRELKITSINQK